MKSIKLIAAIIFAATAFVFYTKLNNANAGPRPTTDAIEVYGLGMVYKVVDNDYTCYLFAGENKAAMQCVPTRY